MKYLLIFFINFFINFLMQFFNIRTPEHINRYPPGRSRWQKPRDSRSRSSSSSSTSEHKRSNTSQASSDDDVDVHPISPIILHSGRSSSCAISILLFISFIWNLLAHWFSIMYLGVFVY
jgi:hypothetical protein